MSEVTPARALAIELKSLWVDAKHGRVTKLTYTKVGDVVYITPTLAVSAAPTGVGGITTPSWWRS